MKSLWTALIFSMSIHTFVGYTFWSAQGISNPLTAADPIEISYIPARIVPPPAQTVQPKPIEYPKPRSAQLKLKKIQLSAEEPAVKQYSRNTRPAESAALAAVPKAASPPIAQRPKTALDFMADPQKGKIFVDYFGRLKERIHLSLRRRYHGGGDSLGVVTLFFVLNPDGSLVKAGVVEKQSDASLELRAIALDSLKRSVPFEGFPKDLGKGSVAFSLKVYFDELD